MIREVLDDTINFIERKEVLFEKYEQEDVEKLIDMVKVAKYELNYWADDAEEKEDEERSEREFKFRSILQDVEKFDTDLVKKLIELEIEDDKMEKLGVFLKQLTAIEKKMNQYRKF